jgi:glutathione synthase
MSLAENRPGGPHVRARLAADGSAGVYTAPLRNMRLCFVVNSVRTQRSSYTTVHLGFAAHRRGHDVAFVSVDHLSHDGAHVWGALVRARGERPRSTVAYVKGLRSPDAAKELARLDDFDVVFLRNNPHVGGPEADAFNPAIEFGRRLKQSGVMVFNDPDGLVRAGSKMYLAGFPVEIRPRTLITRSVERVRSFLRELDGPAVIKPLHGFGGQNVFYVGRGERVNLAQIITTVKNQGYFIVQEYLPAVRNGDKRVLLLGGVPVLVDEHWAAYKRMRPKDDNRNNMHVGGARRPASLSEGERRICDLIRPRLVADGLYFVGVDLVGDRILEINVFAPGGIHNINELYSVDVAEAVVRDLERKVELKRAFREPLPPHVIMRA